MPVPHPTGAVFLSYARQDVAAARRIAEALRTAGVEVWFDEDELRGGDAWDAKIRQQIRECALFLPVISTSTQARREGYFRREWKQAVQRLDDIADSVPFLVPVVIDDTTERGALVPDAFRTVQWTRLSAGEAGAGFCARVKALLRGEVGPGQAAAAPGTGRPRPTVVARNRRAWRIGLVAGAIAASLAATTYFSNRSKVAEKKSPQVQASASNTSQSEARALLTKAWEVMNRTDLYRAELEIADDLCRRATNANPEDPDGWAAWAQVDCWYLYYSLDLSNARRELARSKVTRALKLNPRSFEARLAEASYFVRATPGSAMGVVPENAAAVMDSLRALQVEQPREPRVWFLLGVLERNLGNHANAAEAFDRMAESAAFAAAGESEKGWMYWRLRNYPAAMNACNRSLALHPFRGNLLLKIYLALTWTGDFEVVKEVQAKIPPALLAEDDFTTMLARVYWWRREPAEVQRSIKTVPRDWLTWHNIPKGYFNGEAHRMAGNEEAAQMAWKEALRHTDDQIAKSPQTILLHYRKARLLSELGRSEEARTVIRLALANGTPAESPITTEFTDWAIAIAAGDQASALDLITKDYEANNSWATTWATLRYNPLLDPLRNHPRFQALLARAEADPQRNPHAKPKAAAKSVAASAEKSIAVLAFENRSSEKDGEYFSDGISEELLNVLAKVPGLRVVSRTSAFTFKGQKITAREIGRTLNVTHLVEGSVQRLGSRARITATLIEAETGAALWNDRFDTELKDIFAAQDDIARKIAVQLSLTLGASARATKAVNPEAHRLVLEGRYFWNQRSDEGFATAERLFTRAIELEPQFADAYAGLALVKIVRVNYRHWAGNHAVAEDMAAGRTHAHRAIALDSNCSDAYAALGYGFLLEGRLDEAQRTFESALALNPNSAMCYAWRAESRSAEGRIADCLEDYEKALALDPLSFVALGTNAAELIRAGRTEQGVQMAQRALRLNTNFLAVRGMLASGSLAIGNRDQAIAMARWILERPEITPRWGSDPLALWVLRECGLTDEASRHEHAVLNRYPPGSFMRGYVLVALGRFDEALPHFKDIPCIQLRLLYYDRTWDRWRDDPRFKELIRRHGNETNYLRGRAARLPAGELPATTRK